AGKPVAPALPRGPGGERVRALMDRAADVLRAHPLLEARRARGEGAPNGAWLWGQGSRRSLPQIRDRFGLEGAVIAGADLVRGLGKLAGLRVVDVPESAGRMDGDLRAEVASGLRELDERDFLLLHVEAPDESGHLGDPQKKVEAIERLDEELLGPLLDGLRARGGEWRVMALADHPTPCDRRVHTPHPGPLVGDPSPRRGENPTVEPNHPP